MINIHTEAQEGIHNVIPPFLTPQYSTHLSEHLAYAIYRHRINNKYKPQQNLKD